MGGRLTIGEVSRQAGVAATTLRYYERIGLVPAPVRLGGQRRYDDAVLARLEVIGLCKSAGFALEEIQMLFADDAPGRPASRALAEAKLAEIDAQMASLARARRHRMGNALHVSVD
jgi:MerR family redox-sensitive transcriptional activator SoxR